MDRIAIVVWLRNENSITFMYEPLTERASVDELLSKVQATTLSAAVAQLRYQLDTVGVTFTVAANHLNSEISQTSDYQQARKVSAVGTS
jgi:hypothetical protein